MIAPVLTMICARPASIISHSTLPIFATVIAPDTVTTMVQSGSAAMAESTSNASPNSRPPNAVRDILRSMSAKPVACRTSIASRGSRPSFPPSCSSRDMIII